MKTKVIAGVALALATVLASPAFAQPARAPVWGDQAYAQSGPVRTGPNHLRHPAHQRWDVYNTNGKYVGSDPDPNVREMIGRDHDEQLGNGF